MSMNPGETTSPLASMVCRPLRGLAETARILPAVIPTFRTASSPDSGSITWPFAITRSNFCAWHARAAASPNSIADRIIGRTVSSRFKSMRTLVTGAQGCIGSWVVKRLIEGGHEVVTFDVNESLERLGMIASPEIIRKVDRRTGRIEDGAAFKKLVRDEQIDHIVHLAAVLMPFCQRNPVEGALIN